MQKLILLITCSLMLCSCQKMILSTYKLNRPFEFTAKEEYLKFLEKKLGLRVDQIIYPETIDLLLAVGERESAIYYGCLKNDSIELVSTEVLRQNRDCFGRVISEIKDRISLNDEAMDSLSTKSDFFKYKFRYLNDNRPFALNESPKRIKLVLLYFYATGTYYYPFYHDIVELANHHKDKMDIFLVTMDDISQLK